MKRHCGLKNIRMPIGQPGICYCTPLNKDSFDSKGDNLQFVASELFSAIENSTYVTILNNISFASIDKTKSYILFINVTVIIGASSDAVLMKPGLFNTFTGLVDMSYFDFKEAEVAASGVGTSGNIEMVSMSKRLDTSILVNIPDYYEICVLMGSFNTNRDIQIDCTMLLIEA